MNGFEAFMDAFAVKFDGELARKVVRSDSNGGLEGEIVEGICGGGKATGNDRGDVAVNAISNAANRARN